MLTLTMSRDVDGSWCDVDVHQEVDDTTLNVTTGTIHQVFLSRITYSDERQVYGKYVAIRLTHTFNVIIIVLPLSRTSSSGSYVSS